jgi:hypothetical protein
MGSLAGRQEIIARFVGHTFRREGRITQRRVETKRNKEIYFTGKSLLLATCLLMGDPHYLTLPLESSEGM